MAIPDTLNEWTFPIVEDLCQRGQGESDRHDFKSELPHGNDPKTLTKVCCAFANSEGGFVIVGVGEKVNGQSKQFVPEGSDPDIDIANHFGQKVRADPTVFFSLPLKLEVTGSPKVIYIFHIPQSPRRSHLPTAIDKRTFWKRTNTGCEPMTVEEVRTQFMNYEERRDKLKLLFLELLMNREQLHGLSENRADRNPLPLVDTAVIDRLLVDIYSVIQDDRELVRLLLDLRGRVNAVKMRTNQYFAAVTPPLADTPRAERMYQSWLQSNAYGLESAIDRALKILEDRFDLQNPLTT